MSLIKPSIILYKKLLTQSLQTQQHKERGFTLIELLVAMVILTIVVGMTGTGLVFIMSTNTKSDQQITQQANLRRAADFIADEIKSASVVSASDTSGGVLPTSLLYLEIPVLVELDDITITNALLKPPNIKVPNHGLLVGDAVRFSGTNLSTVGITNNTTTYYVISRTTNTFQVSATSGASSTTIPTAIPQNFAVRRLVGYSIAIRIDTDPWKGPNFLYRATGSDACSATSPNCQVVIDSLTSFSADLTKAPQITIDLNGQLCTPALMANTCSTPALELSKVSITALARATLK